MKHVGIASRKLIIGTIATSVLSLYWNTSISGRFESVVADGKTSEEILMKVPLLPVVFFDSASSDIPERYDTEPLSGGTSSASYRTLHDAYLRVLDVLAEQLSRTTEKLVLHGYEERSGSIDECYLARARAERIKNYLVHDRGIDARRIVVNHSNTNCLPPEISLKGGSRLSCEYRRVEILCQDRSPFPIILEASSRQSFTSAFRNTEVILFDLRSEYISKSQRVSLTRFLEQLPSESELRISGYADVIGRSETGTVLGPQRALGVASFVRQVRPDCRISMLNMNPVRRPPLGLPAVDLPEIRYLSRSVIVQAVPKWNALTAPTTGGPETHKAP